MDKMTQLIIKHLLNQMVKKSEHGDIDDAMCHNSKPKHANSDELVDEPEAEPDVTITEDYSPISENEAHPEEENVKGKKTKYNW